MPDEGPLQSACSADIAGKVHRSFGLQKPQASG